MKLSRPAKRQPPETIVALIDVVFFMLVFFMLIGRMDATAPFDVSPPTAQTGADMPSGGTTISLSALGELAIDGALVADDALNEVMANRLRDTSETLVRINAHRETELRHVLPLISRIEALGAEEVVLVVTPETTPPVQ